MTVYLVGAGPGDPGLLTVRGRELLERADSVLYDRLAEPSLLDLVPAAAERIDVGKRPGGPVEQDELNAMLVERGRRHATVVRLKAGDPFVFGRGGEEALALAAAGVAFEIVPGVTSAIAVPAYAGIPVTHRGLATSFTVVTGHSRHAVDTETNWEALAAAGGTIVVLMGVAHRDEIARRLIAGGLDADTPVAAVHWGTRPSQTTTRATLGSLGATPLEPPVTIVIGAVAGLDLSWRWLSGRRVVVTRARDQASALATGLEALGATVIELPAIEIADPADGGVALRLAAGRLGTFDWVVFTSANAVDRVFAVVRDARSFGGARVAAIGSATATALGTHGIVADLVPASAVAEDLVAAFGDGPGRVLIPRAAVGRDVLAAGLRAAGWDVTVVEAYRTVPAPAPVGPVEADAITFTSSSTVTNYLALGVPVPPVVVCIGSITATTAREAGLHVDAVAEEATIASLIEALVRALGGTGGS